MFCPNCGKSRNSSNKFCVSCGYPFYLRQQQFTKNTNNVLKIKKKIIIPAVSVLFLSVAAVILFFIIGTKPGQTFKIGVDGGSISYENLELIFSDNDLVSATAVTVNEIDERDYILPASMETKPYIITMDSECIKSVTVRIKLNDMSDTTNLKMVFWSLNEGIIDPRYNSYYENVIVRDGFMEAKLQLSDYLAGTPGITQSAEKANRSPKPAKPKAGNPNAVVVVSGVRRIRTDRERFSIVHPAKISDYDADKIAKDLNKLYNKFPPGTYSRRSTWPFQIEIKLLTDAGGYRESFRIRNPDTGQLETAVRNPDTGFIEMNETLFSDPYTGETRKIALEIIAHEWFHFVQANFTTGGQQSCWFDEATATYFGAKYSGHPANIINEYWERVWESLYPVNDNAQEGYARAPLIEYLCERYGEGFLISAYQKMAGPNGVNEREAIAAVIPGPPYFWNAGYYEWLVEGNAFGCSRGLNFYYNNLKKDTSLNFAGTVMHIIVPSKKELESKLSSEPLVLGSEELLDIPSFSARMLALNFDTAKVSAVDDNTSVSILIDSSGSTIDSLFTISNNKGSDKTVGKPISVITRSTDKIIVIPNIKKALLSNTTYLLLVTSLSENITDVNVRVVLSSPPSLDDICGYYENGTQTLEKVHVGQDVYSILNKLIKENDTGAAYLLTSIEKTLSQQGEKASVPFQIDKTGAQTGEIKYGGGSLPFKYEGGNMIIKQELKNADGKTYRSYESILTAKSGSDGSIQVSGTITTISDGFYTDSQHYFPHKSYYTIAKLAGSKS